MASPRPPPPPGRGLRGFGAEPDIQPWTKPAFAGVLRQIRATAGPEESTEKGPSAPCLRASVVSPTEAKLNATSWGRHPKAPSARGEVPARM